MKKKMIEVCKKIHFLVAGDETVEIENPQFV